MSGPPDLPARVDPTSSPRAVPARDPDFPPVPPPEHFVSDNGGILKATAVVSLGVLAVGCAVILIEL